MEFFLEIINTIIYFGCVRDIGALYLNYKPKRLKYEKRLLILIGIIAAGIMLYSNIVIDSIAHMTSILFVGYIAFQESKKSL